MDTVLDRTVRALPLALAALYVLGFLVVGIYLASFGASTLELFKVQYLAAGFWCTVPIAAFLLVCAPLRAAFSPLLRMAELHFDQVRTGWWLLFVTLLVELFTGLVGFVILISIWAKHSSEKSLFKVIFAGNGVYSISPGALVVLYAPIVIVSLGLVARRSVPHEPFWGLAFLPPRKYITGLIDVICILTISLWVAQFARKVYPKIPFSLGGGEPRSVVFVLNEGPNQTQNFLVRDGNGPRTVPYKLVLENEGSFVVLSLADGQKAIEFDRKSVAAVIVLGKLPKDVERQ
jgi:hypothetical protein